MPLKRLFMRLKEHSVSEYQPPVDQLANKLNADPQFKADFQTAIENAQKYGVEIVSYIQTPENYLTFCDLILKTPPSQDGDSRRVYNTLSLFYFILDQSPLKEMQSPIVPLEPGAEPPELTWLSQWIVDYANSWGNYMDTTESAAEIESFKDDVYFNWNDYMAPPSGYFTFNQYFARHYKPGLRPVASISDHSVIASPTDSCFVGWWSIDNDSTIYAQKLLHIKGVEWSIHQLLADSAYKDEFKGGIFTHSFLNTYNYHRWHSPVEGTVLEVKNIQGQCYLDVNVVPNVDGKGNVIKVLNALDGTGYQFVQTRGLVVIDSPIGLVACLPMGMAQVSSVVITAEKGVHLRKGEELGYFQFGGSDFVMVFQRKSNVQLLCTKNQQYLQGMAVGKAHGYPLT